MLALSLLASSSYTLPRLLGFTSLSYTARLYSARHPKRRSKHLCNEDIPFTTVTPVDPETGRLKEPCRLKDLLASIDRKTHFVELVYDSKTAATNVLQQVPIVKIIARADRFQSRKAGKLSRPRQIQQKEVQLTWGVADGDLSHKLNKVRQELEKGNKVDLVFAPKAGTKAPSPVARQGRMESAMRMLGDVAKEWKERETKGLVVVIFLQENLVKSSKSGDAKPNSEVEAPLLTSFP